jgi:hypothetical protein
MISYTTFAVNSTKKTTIEEYLPLLTDPFPKPVKPITKEDRKDMLKKAQERLSLVPINQLK